MLRAKSISSEGHTDLAGAFDIGLILEHVKTGKYEGCTKYAIKQKCHLAVS